MWTEEHNSLYKEFEFKDFKSAVNFINRVAELSEKINHHPHLWNNYKKVGIRLTTHDVGNQITGKDRRMAEKIDKIFTV